jgi:hypothetical protein
LLQKLRFDIIISVVIDFKHDFHRDIADGVINFSDDGLILFDIGLEEFKTRVIAATKTTRLGFYQLTGLATYFLWHNNNVSFFNLVDALYQFCTGFYLSIRSNWIISYQHIKK